MKSVKITYHCDFCKQLIDTDSDTVRAILPGRIGYQDSFLADSEDDIRHYHDYCLEHLLTLHFEEKQEEPEPEMEPEPEEEPKKRRRSTMTGSWPCIKRTRPDRWHGLLTISDAAHRQL